MRWVWLIAALALSGASASAAPQPQAAKPLIEQFSLANGMRVIVIPNHRVPAVSHQLWFGVGASDDPPRKSGLAHYHEHVMFLGTARHKSGEYADMIARSGGQHNAFTGRDATAYYVNIARDRLPLVMELEADRMRGLSPEGEQVLREREVILEERRMRIENVPSALLGEQMDAALYLNHPYRLPVIGWEHEMRGLTREDVLEFHRHYYHPGNATLIVSGDITAAELKPLAERYYAGIPQGPKVVRDWAAEPPARAVRRVDFSHPDVTQPLLRRDYISPPLPAESREISRLAPYFVLEQVLDGGKTGRLYQSLVTKSGVAAFVSASYDGFSRGPAAFGFGVLPAQGKSVAAAEAALDKEIARIVREPVGAAELARAKTQLKAEVIYARQGLQPMAYALGWITSAGYTPEDFLKWPDAIEAVTADDVRQAAASLFLPERSVTGILLPRSVASGEKKP